MKAFGALSILLFFTAHIAGTFAAYSRCQNGGKALTGSYQKCACQHGYKGYDCSVPVTPCEGRPCQHNGKCSERKDRTFTCKCVESYDGMLCEKRVRPCDSHPCKNGGTCSDDGEKCFKCACAVGFKGSACAKKIKPCEIRPCKNGGVCSDKKDGGFVCACKEGFGGIFCEEKNALYSSVILQHDRERVETLETWLNHETDWRLCYRASRDGWRAQDFHARCDFKGPTVTIIRANNMHIFGGYTDVSWGGNAGYRKTDKSFLYSLKNTDSHRKPFRSPVYKNHANAIYTNPSYGPTFGGGHDLYIRDKSNVNTGSYSNLGHTYRAPFAYSYGSTKAKVSLAGVYNTFKPTEMEVFYLI